MTWILYVLFMNDAREMQFVLEKRYLTEQKCMSYYKNNSRYLDKKTIKLIRKRIQKI